jgi:hypothetical protein
VRATNAATRILRLIPPAAYANAAFATICTADASPSGTWPVMRVVLTLIGALVANLFQVAAPT